VGEMVGVGVRVGVGVCVGVAVCVGLAEGADVATVVSVWVGVAVGGSPMARDCVPGATMAGAHAVMTRVMNRRPSSRNSQPEG